MAISVISTLTKPYNPAPPGSQVQGFNATPGEKLLKDYNHFRSDGMGVKAAINRALGKSQLLKRQDESSQKILRWFKEVHQVIELAREAGHDVNNINDARALLNPPKEKPKKKEPSGSELPPDTCYSYPHEDPNGKIVFVRGKVSAPPLTSNVIPELPSNSPAPIDSLSIDSSDPTLLLDKYKDLLCENDTVYFRGRKIQGPKLERYKEYSIVDGGTGWVRAIVAKYDHGGGSYHNIIGDINGFRDTEGLIFRPINRLETINGTPIDGAAVSLTSGNKFNKGFVQDLDREKGKVYEVRNTKNGKYFNGTYIGHRQTVNGNYVLWFKEGFCVEISKDTFELTPIGENKGTVYPSSRRSNRPDRKIATRVAHGELTAIPQNTGRAQPTTPSNAASTSRESEVKVGDVINLGGVSSLDTLRKLPKGTEFEFVGRWDYKGICKFTEVKSDEYDNKFRFTESSDNQFLNSLELLDSDFKIRIVSLPAPPQPTDKKVTLRAGESPEGKLKKGAFYKNTQGHNTFPGNKLLDWDREEEDERSGRIFYYLEFESDKPGFVFTIPITDKLTIEEIPEPKKAASSSTTVVTRAEDSKRVLLKREASPQGKLKKGTYYKVYRDGENEPIKKGVEGVVTDWHSSYNQFNHNHDYVFEFSDGRSFQSSNDLIFEEIPELKKPLASTEIESPPLREGEIFVKGPMVVGGNLELNAVYDIYKPYDVFDSGTKYSGAGRRQLFSAVKLLRIDNEEGSIVYMIENEFAQLFYDDDCPEGFIFKKLLDTGEDPPGARGITKSGHITALSLETLPPQMDRLRSFRIGEGPNKILTQEHYRFCMIVKGELFLTAGKILSINQAPPEGIIVKLELPDGRKDMILCSLSDFIQPIEDPKSRIVLNEKESPEGKLVKDKWYKAYDRTEIDQTAGGARYDSFTKDGSGYYTLKFDSSEDGRYFFAIPIHHPNTTYSFEEVSLNPISTDC